MHRSNTTKEKGYLINNRSYLLLLWIIFGSCQDNYQNCLDLEYGSEYIKIKGVNESDKNYFKYFCKTSEVFGIKIYALSFANSPNDVKYTRSLIGRNSNLISKISHIIGWLDRY